jgi:hypothetical protein
VPFDPKIRHPDSLPAMQPIDDGDLPRDLAALGEQLRDDAAWLAARYPVNSPDAERVSPLRSVRWVYVAAAVFVLAAGIGFVLGTRPSTDVQGTVGIDRIASRQADSSPRVPAATITDRVLDASEAYYLSSDANSAAGLIVPAVLFQNLSGPEQEGLLDLLDEIVPEAIDLSM